MVEKAGLIQSYQDFIIKLLLRKRNMLDISKKHFYHFGLPAPTGIRKTNMLNTLRVTLWLVN